MKRKDTRTIKALGGIGPGGKSPRDYLRERAMRQEARMVALGISAVERARCACACAVR